MSTSQPRSKVYEAIDGERAYQDINSSGWEHKGGPSVEAELLLLEEYVMRARNAWSVSEGNTAALDVIRKVAGVAVRCLENHGCPPRVVKPSRPEK